MTKIESGVWTGRRILAGMFPKNSQGAKKRTPMTKDTREDKKTQPRASKKVVSTKKTAEKPEKGVKAPKFKTWKELAAHTLKTGGSLKEASKQWNDMKGESNNGGE
jgi:hypothetical protein